MKIETQKEKFLEHLSGRIGQFCERIENGEISESFASFELLASIFSAYEGSLSEADLNTAYPIADWRENQVSVPRAILRQIVDGWMKYRSAESNHNLGQAYGIEAIGKGGGKQKRKVSTLDKEQRLSNAVLVELLGSKNDGQPISQDAAIEHVQLETGVPYETIKKAFQKHHKTTLRKLQRRKFK